MADTTTATLARPSAPVITLAGRRRANPSALDTTDRDTIALHMQAENALSVALHLLRNLQTAADLERATGRACRAATLMRRLSAQAKGRTA